MRKRNVFLIFGVVLALVWAYVTWFRTPAPEPETVRVSQGSMAHVVSVTGRVEPIDRITLSFASGGQLVYLGVREGQQTAAGSVVAQLDDASLRAAVSEVRARAERERAVLTQVRAPLTAEARAVHEVAIEQARTAEARALEVVDLTLVQAFTVTDDAVREKIDRLYSDGQGSLPRFGVRFVSGGTTYAIQAYGEQEIELNAQRQAITPMLSRLRQNGIPGSDVHVRVRDTEEMLTFIDTFFVRVADAVHSYVASDSTAQLVYQGYQGAVVSARASMTQVRSALQAAYAAYQGAVTARERALREFEQALAGATTESVLVQESAVRAADASVQSALTALTHTTLTAPASGTIADVLVRTGEAVAPFAPVATLLTEGVYEIEVFVPEVDVAQVSIGDAAQVTFDALGRARVFDAEVTRIAIAETVRGGVPTYKTTLVLVTNDEHSVLRPGMTADVEITTEVREQVLMVPRRSVVRTDTSTLVRVLRDDGTVEDRVVVTGLRSPEGMVEIAEGVLEGERVMVY